MSQLRYRKVTSQVVESHIRDEESPWHSLLFSFLVQCLHQRQQQQEEAAAAAAAQAAGAAGGSSTTRGSSSSRQAAAVANGSKTMKWFTSWKLCWCPKLFFFSGAPPPDTIFASWYDLTLALVDSRFSQILENWTGFRRKTRQKLSTHTDPITLTILQHVAANMCIMELNPNDIIGMIKPMCSQVGITTVYLEKEVADIAKVLGHGQIWLMLSAKPVTWPQHAKYASGKHDT